MGGRIFHKNYLCFVSVGSLAGSPYTKQALTANYFS